MRNLYVPKPVTQEETLTALIRLHLRIERCLANGKEPDVEDLDLVSKPKVQQLERLQLELEDTAQWDAHGDWLDDGWSLHCEKEAYSPEEFEKAEAEHSALQPKDPGVAPKGYF